MKRDDHLTAVFQAKYLRDVIGLTAQQMAHVTGMDRTTMHIRADDADALIRIYKEVAAEYAEYSRVTARYECFLLAGKIREARKLKIRKYGKGKQSRIGR